MLFKQVKYETRSRVKSMCVDELKKAVEDVIAHHVSLEDIGFTFSKVHENAKARENAKQENVNKTEKK